MDNLECGICCQPYDLEKRFPKILSKCLHEICECCALEILKGTGVECPYDRKVTHVMGGNVKFLKKNFKLEEKLFMLKLEEESEKKNSVIYKNEIALGIPCDEDRSHIAVLYCTVCKSNYCERCSKTSHGSVTLAAHEMIKVSDKPEPLLYCPHHSYNVAELFCLKKNCEIKNKVMCTNCHLYGAHKGHEYKTIDEVFDVKMEETSELLKQTNIKIMLVKDCDNCIGELPETINEDHEYIDKNKIDEICEEELNIWKQLNMEALEKETKAKIESNKMEKEYYCSKLEELETLKLECLIAIQRKKTEYFEKLEEIEIIKQKLKSFEIKELEKRSMKAVVKYPNVITFEKQKSRGKIVFLYDASQREDYYDINYACTYIKNLGFVEYEPRKFLLKGQQIEFYDIEAEDCKKIEINVLVIFDIHNTFEPLCDALREKNVKIKTGGNIIFRHSKRSLEMLSGAYHWKEDLSKIARNLQVQILVTTQEDLSLLALNEKFLENILKGNYLDNPYFERYDPEEQYLTPLFSWKWFRGQIS